MHNKKKILIIFSIFLISFFSLGFGTASGAILTSVSIASNNANASLAKVGDIVTVSMTANGTLLADPTVTIAGHVATVSNASGNSYTANYTMQGSDSEGIIAFTINFTDANGSAEVTTTTDGSSVTFDKTTPTLTLVHIASNNLNSSLAKVGDVVTVSMTANTALKDAPKVTIDSHTATVKGTGPYSATYTMESGDGAGAVTFTIDFTDITGNPGTQVTATTDGSSVTFDKTAPTLTLVHIASNNLNSSLAKVGDVVTVSLTASKALLADPTVTIAGHAATVSSASGNSYTAIYTMQSSDTEGVVSFTTDFTDIAGNPGTQVTTTTDGSSITFDKTAPIISITSPANGKIYTTASQITLSGTASDNIGLSKIEVKVGNGIWQPADGTTSWSAQVNLSEGVNTIYAQATATSGNTKITSINVTLDTTPPASVTNPQTITAIGSFNIDNSWTNPVDADFNHIWFRKINGDTLQNVSATINYLNLTWQAHYTQNISAQTVDDYGNVNPERVWFNATVPNNPPVQAPIGEKEVYKGQQLNFIIVATDLDNDNITHGTNATKGSLDSGGIYSWTPGDGDAGVYYWEFNTTDGHGGKAKETIKITVKNPLEFNIKFVEPSIINGNETWIDAQAGHIGKFIGVDGTFKNTGNDTMNLTINETFNGESKNWSSLRSIEPNESLSYAQLFGKPAFEINSAGVQDLNKFNFTFKMDVKGHNLSIAYTNTTTISIPIYPIFRMKQANAGIITVINGRTSTITYTLEANSSVNLTDVSILDLNPSLSNNPIPYFSNISLEANKSQKKTYTYAASTSDLSSMKCEESKFGDYPCIINLANLTANMNGTIITDTDFVKLFVCKLGDANCIAGYQPYRIPYRGSIGGYSGSSNSPGSGGGSGSGSGVGGGGGGGGMPPSEDFNNIEKREVREMSVLSKSVAVYVFKAADPVMAVSFESSVSENDVPVAVEVLKNRAKKIQTDAPGKPYKYFNIFVGMSGFSNKVKNGVVVFRVNNSWLEENGLDPGDIHIYKWNGNWVEKATEIAEKKPNQTYYASLVGNFSSFAIAGIKKSESISTSGQFTNLSNESNNNVTPVESQMVKPPINLILMIAIMPLIGLIVLIYGFQIKRIKNKIK